MCLEYQYLCLTEMEDMSIRELVDHQNDVKTLQERIHKRLDESWIPKADVWEYIFRGRRMDKVNSNYRKSTIKNQDHHLVLLLLILQLHHIPEQLEW